MEIIAYILLIVLLICAIIDYKTLTIPNYLTYPLLLGGIIYQIIQGNIKFMVIGLIFATVISISAYVTGGLGGGDVKLLIAMAPILGLYDWSITIIYACIFGLIGGLYKLYRQQKLKEWFKLEILKIKNLFIKLLRLKINSDSYESDIQVTLPMAPSIALSAWMLFLTANLGVFRLF